MKKKKKSLFKNNCFLQWGLGFVLLVVLISLMLLFFIQKREDYEDIENVYELWSIYDLNIKVLENNISEIMDLSSSDVVCNGFKDKTVSNSGYGEALSTLACEIYLYYYNLIEYDENYHNYIIDYRYESQIASEDIKSLKANMQNDNHINLIFEGMTTIYYDGDYIMEELYDKINYFLENYDLNFYNQENLTYSELLIHKISEISYVTFLSNWVKSEYYGYLN